MRIRFTGLLLVLSVVATEYGHGFGVLPGSGLRGLDAVTLELYVMDDTPISQGDPEIIDAVSSALTAAGVRVLSYDECGDSATCASTYLRVHGARGSTGRAWAYLVELDLCQGVTLIRDPKIDIGAETATFHAVKVGLAAADRVPQAVKASAVSLAQQLANAFKRENKK
jgi:hypothetical protein